MRRWDYIWIGDQCVVDTYIICVVLFRFIDDILVWWLISEFRWSTYFFIHLWFLLIVIRTFILGLWFIAIIKTDWDIINLFTPSILEFYLLIDYWFRYSLTRYYLYNTRVSPKLFKYRDSETSWSFLGLEEIGCFDIIIYYPVLYILMYLF